VKLHQEVTRVRDVQRPALIIVHNWKIPGLVQRIRDSILEITLEGKSIKYIIVDLKMWGAEWYTTSMSKAMAYESNRSEGDVHIERTPTETDVESE
jgi:hypothetical protein